MDIICQGFYLKVGQKEKTRQFRFIGGINPDRLFNQVIEFFGIYFSCLRVAFIICKFLDNVNLLFPKLSPPG